MGQNQPHVAKHEGIESCILSKNVKICELISFHQNQIIPEVPVTIIFLSDFSYTFLFEKSAVKDDKSCFLIFKASFLISFLTAIIKFKIQSFWTETWY